MLLDRLIASLTPHGLIVLGGFHPTRRDGLPPGVSTVILVGNAGPAMWQAFAAARRDEPDPLDAWTRRAIDNALAEAGGKQAGFRALFPFEGPPYPPIQRWAQRAGIAFPSPLGMIIHPHHGLWHAYRAVMLADAVLELPPTPPSSHPCEACADRPCLAACPVEAFTGADYRVADCADHLRRESGAECLAGGCLARRACPVGRDQRYEPEQMRFHMARFLAARGA